MSKIIIYLAGIMDGEGTICISKQAPLRKHPSYCLVTSVGMANKEVPELLLKTFGGRIRSKYRPANKPQWKFQWRWSASGDVALRALEVLYPFLIVKKKQVELALEFRQIWKDLRYKKNKRLVNEINKDREDIYYKMRLLNKGG